MTVLVFWRCGFGAAASAGFSRLHALKIRATDESQFK